MPKKPSQRGPTEYYFGPGVDEMIQKIANTPHDDQLRIRLAGLLQDSEVPGDAARATLISLQFGEEAAQDRGLHARNANELRTANALAELIAKQIGQLLSVHERTWLQPLDRDKVQSVIWDKGVPISLRVSGEVFTEEMPKLLAQAPTVHGLSIHLPQEGVIARTLQMLQHTCFQQITNLRLMSGPWGPGAVRAVAESPHMQNITQLDISDTQISATLGNILSSSSLPKMHTLVASGNRIDEDLALALLRVRSLPPSLRELILTDCGIDDDTSVSLAANSLFSTLHRLDLRQNPMTLDAIRMLLSSEALINVALQLDLNDFEQPEASEVAQELLRRELVVQQSEAQLSQGA